MEKYPSLATAKIGIINEKIDKQMCQVYHTPILKKFSNESHHDGIVEFIKVFVSFILKCKASSRTHVTSCAQPFEGPEITCIEDG